VHNRECGDVFSPVSRSGTPTLLSKKLWLGRILDWEPRLYPQMNGVVAPLQSGVPRSVLRTFAERSVQGYGNRCEKATHIVAARIVVDGDID
jgi:hypothetical protein